MNRQTIIVTGAAGALGSALSLVCAREGCNVVMLDRNQRMLEKQYDRIQNAGFREAILFPQNLAEMTPDGCSEMLAAIENQFGGLDALVHCAAHFEGLTPLEQVQPQGWLEHIQVNLNAPWLLSAACLPLLRQSTAGRLYFLLEDLARMHKAFWGPYGVAKHGLHALVRQFSAECGSSGIQVLGIDPGPMRSELRSRAFLSENPGDQIPPDVIAEALFRLLTGEREPAGDVVSPDELLGA